MTSAQPGPNRSGNAQTIGSAEQNLLWFQRDALTLLSSLEIRGCKVEVGAFVRDMVQLYSRFVIHVLVKLLHVPIA